MPGTFAMRSRNSIRLIDVSDDDRALAFANIEKAAKSSNVDLSERHGASSAFTRNGAARRPPPRALRPSASAENCKEAGARGAATPQARKAAGAGWRTRTMRR